MQKIQEFCRLFAMAVRTQLHAVHAQLNKTLQMDIFWTISTFSEMRVFLNNYSTEFQNLFQGDTLDSG